MRPHILATWQDQLGLDDAVRGRFAKGADPPLSARQRGRVDFKLLRLGDVCRGGLESAHVGSVAELGLQVAAEDAAVGD